MKSIERSSDTTVLVIALGWTELASGAADAIAFLGLDKVFSAFMTGNLVFSDLSSQVPINLTSGVWLRRSPDSPSASTSLSGS